MILGWIDHWLRLKRRRQLPQALWELTGYAADPLAGPIIQKDFMKA